MFNVSKGKQIWLIGGTQESAELARSLLDAQLPCLVSVTTEAARSLYPSSPDLTVWIGRVDATMLPLFLQRNGICAIVDASHPFAVEISQQAIATAAAADIPYLRYERRALSPISEATGPEETGSSPFLCFSRFSDLLATDVLSGQRVLLTIGYRPLAQFQAWQKKAILFARILPSVPALEAAIAAGFSNDRLIALRPPISADLERALWQHWQISCVVTKASGIPGGEAVKRQIAQELGIPLVTIARPAVAYPQQTQDLAQVVQFCRAALNKF